MYRIIGLTVKASLHVFAVSRDGAVQRDQTATVVPYLQIDQSTSQRLTISATTK